MMLLTLTLRVCIGIFSTLSNSNQVIYDSLIEKMIYNDMGSLSFQESNFISLEEKLACEIRNDIWEGRFENFDRYSKRAMKMKNSNAGYISACFSLARLAHERGEYVYADSLYEVTSLTHNKATDILHQIEYADNLISLSEFSKADSILEKIGIYFSKNQRKASPLFAYYLEKFGLVSLYNSQFEKAKNFFERAENYWNSNLLLNTHPWA